MPSSKPTFRERLSYAFDNTLSRGPLGLILWLGIGTVTLIILALILVNVAQANDSRPMIQVFWDILFQALTPNPVASNSPESFLVIMFFVTIGSLFMVSILIGILNNAIGGRVDSLRRGRSKVIESGHTVVLGWSHQIFTIVSELVIANENRKQSAVIVILADRDKVEMEDEIRGRIPNTKNTRVICRNGNPIELADLEIVSSQTARSIIVLPPDENDPDIFVIKTVLAITNNPNRRSGPYHIVTQLREEKNLDVIEMIGRKNKDNVQAVLVGELIARVVAQTSRQSGLSIIYTELMNFGGDEVYFTDLPASLIGKTYADSQSAYEDSSVMGLKRGDGTILLNPPAQTDMRAGDRLFALSQDDDTIKLSGLTNIPVQKDAVRSAGKARKASPEKCLILGWNRSGPIIVCELDNYVAKGSQVTVVSSFMDVETLIREHCGKLANQKINVIEGETTDRALLRKLNIPNYDHVIVLANEGLETQEADAKTLVTLLNLRNISETDETPFSIVSEMLDLRNRELAEVAGVDDFVVSEHLVSLMMSQLSEDADLFAIFNDLFDPEGSEIYLKPVTDYVAAGKPVDFYTVIESATRRNETAIGYRLMSEVNDPEKSYGIHTNPKKSQMVMFAPEDKVIVLAES